MFKIRSTLFFSILAPLAVINTAHADQACYIPNRIDTGVVLSDALLNEVSEIGDVYKPLTLIGKIHDYNGNGSIDFLSLEGSDQRSIYMRDGLSGERIAWGPHTIPAGSVPTQLASIGDSNSDGKPEFAVGIRYPNGGHGDRLFVFNGASGALMSRFPSVINGLDRRRNSDGTLPPPYQNSSNISGLSAGVGNTINGRKVIYFDSNDLGGRGFYVDQCMVNDMVVPCYVVITPSSGSGNTNRDFGSKLVNLKTAAPGSAGKLVIADPSMTYRPPSPNPLLQEYAGGIFSLSSGNIASLNLLPRSDHLRLGFSLIGVGDLDNDGTEEFATTSPGDGLDNLAGGFVDIYSGASFMPRKVLLGGTISEGAQFGYAIDGGDDLNGDGTPDIIVTSPAHGAGKFAVYSTSPNDNAPSYEFTDIGAGVRLGQNVVALGAERFVIADGAGHLLFFRLGQDVRGGSDGGPNGIPDRCDPEVLPVPTPQPLAIQELNDKLFIEAQKIRGQLVELRTFNYAPRNQKQFLNGIKNSTKKIVKMINDNQPLIQSVHVTLLPELAVTYQDRNKAVQKAFKNRDSRKRRSAVTKMGSLNNTTISRIQAGVSAPVKTRFLRNRRR